MQFFNISITEYNLQKIADRMLMLIKRLIAYFSVYNMSYEECYEGFILLSYLLGT
jgi:hypothetical protein